MTNLGEFSFGGATDDNADTGTTSMHDDASQKKRAKWRIRRDGMVLLFSAEINGFSWQVSPPRRRNWMDCFDLKQEHPVSYRERGAWNETVARRNPNAYLFCVWGGQQCCVCTAAGCWV